MKNPYNEIRANLQRSELLVAQYSEPNKVESAKREILRRIDDHTLYLLVYGAYNSGKSTLVNALLGEARARISDVPTTYRIDSYDWEGYRLLDTPGVNAPIEHEQITAAQLKRTHAIVLVIREGDQDARDVYDRLFEMMSDRKKIFVVLNHELESAEEVAVLISRIADILVRSGSQRGIDERSLRAIPIFPVNLYTAWNGRSRRQEKLTEHSGFVRFLGAFYDWTRNLDNETHHLSEVKGMVKSLWYVPASDECAKRRETPNGEEMAQLREAERAFAVWKNQLHGEASRRTARAIDRVRPDIVSLLRESQSESQARDSLNGVMEPVVHEIQTWLNDEFKIDSTVSAAPASMKTEIELQAPKRESALSTPVDMMPVLKAISEKAADPKVIKDILLTLRGTKFLGIRDLIGLKGRWHTTLGKYAGNISRILGPLLQVSMAIFDAIRAHNEQEKQNSQMRKTVTEQHQAAENLCGDLKRNLLSVVDGIIDQTMDALISAVRNRIAELRQGANEQEECCQQLADYRAELEAIRF